MPENHSGIKFYEEIFKHNGASYHAAMELNPNARDAEFNLILSQLSISSGQTLLDVPAGGGYLNRYLPTGVKYSAYDFSGGFGHQPTEVRKCTETAIPLPDNSADHVVCLAALHHVENRSGFYQEVKRLLKPGGTLIIGDVLAGSQQDTLLNTFVNKWNTLGHQGNFIQPARDLTELKATGFKASHNEHTYQWVFQSNDQAARYFRLLFNMDKNPPSDLLNQQLRELNGTQTDTKYSIDWRLGLLVASLD